MRFSIGGLARDRGISRPALSSGDRLSRYESLEICSPERRVTWLGSCLETCSPEWRLSRSLEVSRDLLSRVEIATSSLARHSDSTTGLETCSPERSLPPEARATKAFASRDLLSRVEIAVLTSRDLKTCFPERRLPPVKLAP